MPLQQYDIARLFQIVWNYRALPFPLAQLPTNMIPQRLDNYNEAFIPARKEKSSLGPSFYANNLIGIEVFMPITLKYTDQDKSNNKELQLENTIISISNREHIVETPLVNRQGNVKEQIQTEDWIISIKGMIVNDSNDYPDDAVKDLKDMMSHQNVLDIENVLTAICLAENEKVVKRSFHLPEMRGIQNAQAFEIELISDIPFELIVE